MFVTTRHLFRLPKAHIEGILIISTTSSNTLNKKNYVLRKLRHDNHSSAAKHLE